MANARRPPVSLTMIVRDAADTLPRCLASVEGLFDEIVVVDTGSTDDTATIARALGARVVEREWPESFAEARNTSLRAATGDWVCWLDADEWLDEINRSHLARRLDQLDHEPCVYFMEQRSPMGVSRLSVVQPRLFRRLPEVRWAYRVHEQILPACLERGDMPVATDVVIHHSGYESPALARAKDARNLRLIERELRENPADPWVRLQLARLLPAARRDEARHHLTRALECIAPGHGLERSIVSAWARLLREESPSADQLAQLNRFLDRFPNDTELLFTLGTMAYQRGDLDRAGDAFARLVERAADADEFFTTVDHTVRASQARHNLAIVRLRQGRCPEAETIWRGLLACPDGAVSAWLGLAEIYLAQGRWNEVDAALSCIPPATGALGREIRMLLARIELARARYEPAIARLQSLANETPEVAILLLLARAHILAGQDFDAAEEALVAVLRIDPENPEANRCLRAIREHID